MYLHQHSEFKQLLQIVADEQAIHPLLIEKDYYIMHCLYALQKQGFDFELKGGTSLSKGYQLIYRFSEDIDICIHPDHDLPCGKNHHKPIHVQARRAYYDDLAQKISIDGIEAITRDYAFDDLDKYRSAGIRLHYQGHFGNLSGVKDGILLEVGFDQTTPYQECDMSSWAYEKAVQFVDIIDNRALRVKCYHPAYTLIEKMQAISTKYRKYQETGEFGTNFLRHYYDIYCLLQNNHVQAFIGTQAYHLHKEHRFRQADQKIIAQNPAFLLAGDDLKLYEQKFESIQSLFYRQAPSFKEILAVIAQWIDRL